MTRKRVGHLHKDYVKSVIFSQALSGLAIGLVSCPDSNEGRKLAHMRPHHDRPNHRDEDLVGSQVPITPNLWSQAQKMNNWQKERKLQLAISMHGYYSVLLFICPELTTILWLYFFYCLIHFSIRKTWNQCNYTFTITYYILYISNHNLLFT